MPCRAPARDKTRREGGAGGAGGAQKGEEEEELSRNVNESQPNLSGRRETHEATQIAPAPRVLHFVHSQQTDDAAAHDVTQVHKTFGALETRDSFAPKIFSCAIKESFDLSTNLKL